MAKGFKQENDRACFLKGNSSCPKDQELWRGTTRDRKVFQKLAQKCRKSLDSGPPDSSREDAEKPTHLRDTWED